MHFFPRMCALLMTGLLIAGDSVTVSAQESERRRLIAVRTSGPIQIDGRFDEADWANAPAATAFTQSEPREGEPASEVTDARVLFDDETLYVGIFAAHRDPRHIIVNELKRDFDGNSTDWVAVIVDPFLDRRNGYQFGVNPAGAIWDSQKFNEGRERNLSWDGAWTARTTIGADGWRAEIAIPFRTMQFTAVDVLRWGINFQRHLQGRLENSFWAPIPRQYALDRLSLAGTLEGLAGVRAGANLRVKPYVSGRAAEAGGPAIATGDVGFDVKYGIRSSLTADATVNTDFSQVEADVQQVGATRFSVLFPEKREFFLENSGVFQFGPGTDRSSQISAAAGTSAGGRDNSVQNELALFFSRRIGLSRLGEAIPIAAGGRLTGRVGDAAVGALHVRQRAGAGEPPSQFTVLRARRNLFSTSDVGVMFVERDGDVSVSSRVFGVDANVRPSKDLLVYGYLAKGTGEEPGRLPGRDTTARGGLVWRNGRWVADASYGFIGQQFMDHAGFVPRVGIRRAQATLGRRFRPRRTASWLREVYPALGLTDVRRESGAFDARYWEQRLLVTLDSGATVEVGANPNTEDLTVPFVIGRSREIAVQPGQYAFTDRFVAVSTTRSRRLAADARVSHGGYYDGRRTLVQLGASARLDTHLSGSVTIARDEVTLPQRQVVTTQVTLRMNYGFSTRAFLNALVQYNSDARQWSSNVRFNLIHHPLSDLFVVYGEQRADTPIPLRGRSLAIKVTQLLAF